MKKIELLTLSTRKIVLITVLGASRFLIIGIPRLVFVTELPKINTALIPGSSPRVCLGYDPEQDKFGFEYQACPKGYAFFAVDDPAGESGPANIIGAVENCCPLPSPDILTDEHVFSQTSCPED